MFRVDLDSYRGPLDLLLYLVRKQELDVHEIPIARVTEQYVEHLSVLAELNVDEVGEFIEVASTLLEIKSQLLLPHGEEESETLEDPREELVQRLLDYKRYKDAASLLDEEGRAWQQRYPRLADDAPPRQTDLGSQPIQEIELWDLVSAFGRILRENQATQPSSIVYDDTPIRVHMQRIHAMLVRDRQVSLSGLLVPGMHKSAVIGLFLAILELVRHFGAEAEQRVIGGEIIVVPGSRFSTQADFSQADNYGSQAPPASVLAGSPESTVHG